MYKGFNTIQQTKKFGMQDFELIKRDLMNSFLIREGTVPGRPDLGTKIWSFIFEPSIDEVRFEIKQEVERIIKTDPRLKLDEVFVSYDHNVVIIEAVVSLMPNYDPIRLAFTFDRNRESLYIN